MVTAEGREAVEVVVFRIVVPAVPVASGDADIGIVVATDGPAAELTATAIVGMTAAP